MSNTLFFMFLIATIYGLPNPNISTTELAVCPDPGIPANGTGTRSVRDEPFYEGTKFSFECSEGYELVGQETIMCRNDSTWSFPRPLCKLRNCESLKNPEGGVWNTTSFSYGKTVSLECSEGYVLRDKEVSNITCTSVNDTELEWSGEWPVCQKLAVCPDPGMPANGTGIRSVNDEPFYEGTQFSFECSEGYEMVGQETILCRDDSTWSSPRPRCKPNITCENLPVDPHARLVVSPEPRVSDYYVPGDAVEVKCNPGYRPKYTDGYDIIFCEDDATWDDTLYICQEAVCSPIVVKNGYTLARNPSNEYKHEDEIRIRCNPGYRLIGNNWNRCLNGIWQHRLPKCKEITCRNPGVPEYGNQIISSSTFRVNSTVSFCCFEGYTLTGSPSRTCMSNGQWDGRLASCTQTGASGCPNPGEPIDGTRIGNDFGVGDTVNFLCNSGFYLVGSPNRTCQANGKWDGEEALCREWSYVDRVQDVKVQLLDQLDAKITLKDSESSSTSFGHMSGRSRKPLIQNTGGLLVLYFVLDSSGSVGKENFNKSVQFVKALVERVGISETLKVGIVTYGRIAKRIVFPLGSTEAHVLEKLSNVTYIGGATATKPALEEVLNTIKSISRIEPKKRKIKSLVFLITDGFSNHGGNPEETAKEMKNSSIEIFVIGVKGQKQENVKNMRILATSPNHIIMINDYNEIENLVNEMFTNKSDFSRCGISFRYDSVMQGRVRHGRPSKVIWPWMAHLTIQKENITTKMVKVCGGSIIDNWWILTAAHCVANGTHADNITVTLGVLDLEAKDNVNRQTKAIDRIILHENYCNKTFDYDIALLKLKTPLVYGNHIRKICTSPDINEIIGSNSILYKSMEKVTVIGFGITEHGQTTELNEVELTLQSQEECRHSAKIRNVNTTDRMICAGEKEGGKDSSKGDSGGPLMQKLKSGSKHYWVQIGIVSWSFTDKYGVKGYYGYYTHLAFLRRWIDDTMKHH